MFEELPAVFGPNAAGEIDVVTALRRVVAEPVSVDSVRLLAILDAAGVAESQPEPVRALLAEAYQRQQGWVAVRLFEAIVAIVERVGRDGRGEWQAEEVAVALRLGKGAAEHRINDAVTLIRWLPQTRRALEAGQINLEQAKVLIAELGVLTDREKIAEAESRLLAKARDAVPRELARRARALMIELDPDAAAERRESGRAGSDVRFFPGDNGMATLEAFGPAQRVRPLFDAVNHAADLLPTRDPVSGERIPIGVQRVTALYQLISRGLATRGCSGCEDPSGARAAGDADPGETSATSTKALAHRSRRSRRRHARPVVTHVLVDLPTLLGLAQNPGELVGYGPIDPEFARELASDSEWQRWVTDPVDGHLLDEGRRRCPSPRLRRYLKARDPYCRLPCCQVPSAYTQADHGIDYVKGGRTSAAVMGELCEKHNGDKHNSKWLVLATASDGSIVWQSALGRRLDVLAHPALPLPVKLPPPPIPEVPPDDEEPPF